MDLLSPESIRARRQKLGLTQARLAELAGLTQASLSNYESGRRDLLGEYLRALNTALTVLEAERCILPAVAEVSSV